VPAYHHAFDVQSALAPPNQVGTAPPGLESYNLFQHYVDAPSTVDPKSPFSTSSEAVPKDDVKDTDKTESKLGLTVGDLALGVSGKTGGELSAGAEVKKPLAPWLSIGANAGVSGTPNSGDPPVPSLTGTVGGSF